MIDTHGINKILIIKLGSVGDIVHTLPTLNALRAKFSQARITWLVKEEFTDLLLNHPSLDEVIPMSFKGSKPKVLKEISTTLKKIRQERYDALLELQGDLRGGIISLFSGVPLRLGYRSGSSRVDRLSTIFNNVKIRESAGHILESNLNFAQKLGAEAGKITFNLHSGEKDREYIGRFLESNGILDKKIVIIHPGTTWITKKWPMENYARLADAIKTRLENAEVVVTCSAQERPMAEELARLSRHQPVVSCPTTLKQLVALIERCTVFVSSDTGPLHIAAAAGKKTVGLYGPIDAVRNGPYGTGNIVIRKPLDCSPCWKRECEKPVCMNAITVNEVFEAVLKLYA